MSSLTAERLSSKQVRQLASQVCVVNAAAIPAELLTLGSAPLLVLGEMP
jgi:hypothetical protein